MNSSPYTQIYRDVSAVFRDISAALCEISVYTDFLHTDTRHLYTLYVHTDRSRYALTYKYNATHTHTYVP
jgi:hypothetical protein